MTFNDNEHALPCDEPHRSLQPKIKVCVESLFHDESKDAIYFLAAGHLATISHWSNKTIVCKKTCLIYNDFYMFEVILNMFNSM